MNDNEFGRLIRTYRLQRGWKQADLADRWGYSREYVSKTTSSILPSASSLFIS
ncbi:helix-turn-helix domain-containing protein [Dictyobacter vulcani]|uniref:helix-turn-helix domain-containing protein n=1 Tax=Dictyobacter vulcani TaxID=2607529 RepID=UPI0012502E0C